MNNIMKKNYLFLATAIVALAGCSDNTYMGDLEGGGPNNMPISFNMNTPALNRATEGAAAATLLGNNFVVFGYKTVSSSPQTVFNNYQVNFVANTANTTESNSANWEYVSYKNLPVGVSTNVGVRAFSALTSSGQPNETAIDQTIKYWDFGATQYDFFAYSLGVGNDHDDDAGTAPQYARVSALSNSTYTIEGSAAELGTCYISNKKTLTSLSTSATEVDLEFLSFLSKVELKFYEIIPGYSVKSVKFYPSAAGASTTTPSLYAGSSVIPTGGKYTVTFDANGKPQLALAASDPTPTTDTKIDFSTTLSNYKDKEYQEASEDVYLGRASNDATSTNTIPVLPNPDNTNALNLKMDFTLVSRDGSGETINMTGATAVIPAAYAKWKPNYKYTYIFKISDNTNAQSGTVTGLYPITLDAIVTDAQDGSQETITTVSDPSITTYAKGEMVTANNEYLTSANIYIVVNNGTSLTIDTNAKLYTAEVEAGAAQGITEETVANALTVNSDGYDAGTVLAVSADLTGYYEYNGSTYVTATTPADGVNKYYKPVTASVKDANGKKLIVKAAAGLSAITEIAAADAPDGKAITVAGAKFTPAAAGNYVFEYTDGSSNKHYKIIKVVAE